jgi:hypothetical protein
VVITWLSYISRVYVSNTKEKPMIKLCETMEKKERRKTRQDKTKQNKGQDKKEDKAKDKTKDR